MKTWLKGGLIGVGLGLLFFLFGLFVEVPSFLESIMVPIAFVPYFLLFIMQTIFMGYYSGINRIGGLSELTFLIFLCGYFFVIGAIIGLIIQKVKGK